MRRMLTLRKRWRALGEGKCEFLQPDNEKILSYILRHGSETILVVANLSRFAQPVELDLSAFKTLVPMELFGRTKFPAITEAPYFLTLGPHNFFWFSLEPVSASQPARLDAGRPASVPSLAVNESWLDLFSGTGKLKFEALLPDYLKTQPWLGGRTRTMKFATLKEHFRVPLPNDETAALTLIQVEFIDAGPELHVMPLAFATGPDVANWRAAGVAELTFPEPARKGLLYDAFANPAFAEAMLGAIRRRERLSNQRGELDASSTVALRRLLNTDPQPQPVVRNTHDGNTTVVFGDSVVLKFFRHVEPGVNPELEVGRFLTSIHFPHSAPLLGALERRGVGDDPITLAVARVFVAHARNGWEFTLDAIGHYYDRVLAVAAQGQPPQAGAAPDHIGTYLEFVRLLGQRTAALHLALASGPAGSEFDMEPVTRHSLRGVFQSMRSLVLQNSRLLRKLLKSLPPELIPVAERVAGLENVILQRYHRLIEQAFPARRIRIHGDFHLGQVLWTGRDFVFLDFEGDGSKDLRVRRIKRSPLRDVVRMLRSFHHAAYDGLRQHVALGAIPQDSLPKFEPWVRHWNQAVSRSFVQAYCAGMRPSEILPADPDQLRIMLLAYLLDQLVEELGRELRRHSENVRAPLQAIIYLMEEPLDWR
jgi:maltose alpha-D-glucosyltransferase/alpha-amylase